MSSDFGFEPDTEGKPYFISYKTEDSAKVGEIARELHNMNVPLWYDRGIKGGEKWEKRISLQIANCEALILFATTNLFADEETYVKTEYDTAKNKNKNRYVVWIERIDRTSGYNDVWGTWYSELEEYQGFYVRSGSSQDIATGIDKTFNLKKKEKITTCKDKDIKAIEQEVRPDRQFIDETGNCNCIEQYGQFTEKNNITVHNNLDLLIGKWFKSDNSDQVLFLCSPQGSGKTLYCKRFAYLWRMGKLFKEADSDSSCEKMDCTYNSDIKNVLWFEYDNDKEVYVLSTNTREKISFDDLREYYNPSDKNTRILIFLDGDNDVGLKARSFLETINKNVEGKDIRIVVTTRELDEDFKGTRINIERWNVSQQNKYVNTFVSTESKTIMRALINCQIASEWLGDIRLFVRVCKYVNDNMHPLRKKLDSVLPHWKNIEKEYDWKRLFFLVFASMLESIEKQGDRGNHVFGFFKENEFKDEFYPENIDDAIPEKIDMIPFVSRNKYGKILLTNKIFVGFYIARKLYTILKKNDVDWGELFTFLGERRYDISVMEILDIIVSNDYGGDQKANKMRKERIQSINIGLNEKETIEKCNSGKNHEKCADWAKRYDNIFFNSMNLCSCFRREISKLAEYPDDLHTLLSRGHFAEHNGIYMLLNNVDFKGADLSNAEFDGVKFTNCDFEGAKMCGSSLKGAHFINVNMQKANFEDTNMKNAHFDGENHIENGHFSNANMSGVCFYGDNYMETADFRNANLTGAYISRAHMNGVKLGGANMREANLVETHLEDADLSYASLREADVSSAFITGAHFINTNLHVKKGTLLATSGLDSADIADAFMDNDTRDDIRRKYDGVC